MPPHAGMKAALELSYDDFRKGLEDFIHLSTPQFNGNEESAQCKRRKLLNDSFEKAACGRAKTRPSNEDVEASVHDMARTKEIMARTCERRCFTGASDGKNEVFNLFSQV